MDQAIWDKWAEFIARSYEEYYRTGVLAPPDDPEVIEYYKFWHGLSQDERDRFQDETQ